MNSADAILCLLPLPGHPGSWLAGRGSGLARSDDGGIRWSAVPVLPGPDQPPITTLATASDGELLAGTAGGVLRSPNSGERWDACPMPAPPPTVSALAVSQDGVVLAGTVEDGVLRSPDGGLSWECWNFGLLDPSALCLALAAEDATGQTVLVGTGSGIVRSTSSGRGWRYVTGTAALCLVEDRSRPGTYYAGSEEGRLLCSQDAGATWQATAVHLSEPMCNLISPMAKSAALIVVAGATLLLLDETLSCCRSVALDEPALCAAADERTILIGCASGRILHVEL